MAYFPNGAAGMDYEERYCAHCVHNDEDKPCAVLLAHTLYNYDECNNPNSILHLLIPRSKDSLGNEECRMFVPLDSTATRAAQRTDEAYREWLRQRSNTKGL